MDEDFWNTVRAVVGNMLAQRGAGRHGIVHSVDPARCLVKVVWDEENTPSGWLPMAQQGAGGNWSVVCLPPPGTQVFCAPDMGDQGHMVVLGAVHSSQQPPGKVTPYGTGDGTQTPQALAPGEVTLMHSSGASFRLTTDASTGGPVVEIVGTLKVTGDIILTGDVYDVNKHWGSLDQLRQVYNLHDHSGVQPGGGNTAQTTIPVNHR